MNFILFVNNNKINVTSNLWKAIKIINALTRGNRAQVQIKFWGLLHQTFVLKNITAHTYNTQIWKNRRALLSHKESRFVPRNYSLAPPMVRFFYFLLITS